MCVCVCGTQGVFKAARHHGVVSAEDAEGMVFGMFQKQTQAEAMMTLVVGGYRQLKGSADVRFSNKNVEIFYASDAAPQVVGNRCIKC